MPRPSIAIGDSGAVRAKRRRGAGGDRRRCSPATPAELRAARRGARDRGRRGRTARRRGLAAARADGLDDDPARRRSTRPSRRRGAATSPAARAWLLVREFRPPTRFSRAAADATLCARPARAGRRSRPPLRQPRSATDLLDTYDGRLRAALAGLGEAEQLGFAAHSRRGGALPSSATGRSSGRPIARNAVPPRGGRQPLRSSGSGRSAQRFRGARPALARGRQATRGLQGGTALAGGDAAPRRSARPVPAARHDRVRPRRQRRARDQGLRDSGGDHVPGRRRSGVRRPRGSAARSRPGRHATRQGRARRPRPEPRQSASRGGAAVAPETLDATVDGAVADLGSLYPAEWKEAAETADFDVIAAALDRMQAAAASGDWGAAESARIEAYGIFELGPEQRLRGLAPSLFQGVETLFWYGTGDQDGLVRLIKRKAPTCRARGRPRGARLGTCRKRNSGSEAGPDRASRSSRTARSSSSARGSRAC